MEKFEGSLHNHTDYSNFRLRDSINKVESLIDRAIELNHSVLAITEHETISSSVAALKYYNKIKENNPNFKLILGNEIYLCRNGLNSSNYQRGEDKFYHFILLAKDSIGHEQIRKISTAAWSHSFKTGKMIRVPTYYSDLTKCVEEKGHLIASTACLGGLLPTQILKLKEDNSKELSDRIDNWCMQMVNFFGKGNFFLELQPSFTEEQIYVNNELIKLSKRLDIPFIITTDSHYLKKEDRPIHKAFLNAQNGDREVDDFYSTTYLMDNDEIYHYLKDNIGEENLQLAFQNIEKIRDMCSDYSLEKPLKIPRLHWKTPIPFKNKEEFWQNKLSYYNVFKNSEYKEDNLLIKIVINVIEENSKLQNEETYNEINNCLKDIWISSEANKARWSAYLLNLQDIIDICWENTLVGPGRGSGVGFLLLYIASITQINPLWEKTKTYRFRFLNPKRVSPLDIDIDIESSKRADVLRSFREVYGDDRVANVLTLKREKAKSTILTAARGLNIDVDIASYLASMVGEERGLQRTLEQTFYGDEKQGIKPNYKFREEMEDNYPELWNVARNIEGLICGTGVHAGGVIFVDEPFTKTTALMRSPQNEIITQFDLHDSEFVGNIKYDILSVSALDKIHITLDLLVKYNFIEKKDTLKETYENAIGIYNIERDNQDMWKKVWNNEILNLFQMNKQSGIQGISILKPTSVDELAILNSTIRLMPQEKGGEMPTNKLARFKNDRNAWLEELKSYGLGEKEKEILEPIVGISYGLCISQEQFMQLVQLKELGGFSLEFADRLRKSIAKKNPKQYEDITKEFFKVTKEKNCNQKLCNYVWNVLIAMSKGYGFNASHTLAYSLIGLQEMNLAFRFPIIFWNCACLIADAGDSSMEKEEDIEDYDMSDEEEIEDDDFDDFNDEIEINSNENEVIKKKKKIRKVDFGKIAAAIGQMKTYGIKIDGPNINLSEFTYVPNVEKNSIVSGLSGMTRIGNDLIKRIIENRPYTSLEDFMNRIKVNKLEMVNLIKSGCFDCFEERTEAMNDYLKSVAGLKKDINLRNMAALIKYDLIPEKYELSKKIFNYNKYLKSLIEKTEKTYFFLNDIALDFYEKHFNIDYLIPCEDDIFTFKIEQSIWKKIYTNGMIPIKNYIKNNKQEFLDKLNNAILKEISDKYAIGNISKWEMDSCSFYAHKHELADIDKEAYGIEDFNNLSEEPVVERTINIKGKIIPLFYIERIAGTVLDKQKGKHSITLLTTDGVVEVKIFGNPYTEYDKRISEKDEVTGKKHIVEKSWFTRGNKLIITGLRRGSSFIAKKYARTPYHLVEKISKVNEDGTLETRGER